MKKILVVAAHPDDEALGCGGAIARHVDEGDEVHVVFMADGVTSRKKLAEDGLRERNKAAYESCEILGAQSPQFLGFPDNKMDTVALLDVVQELEKIMDKIQPSIIYTHHDEDLNVDHRITHQAVLTACRPQPENYVNEIYSFEVLSSTEWVAPSAKNTFIPNRFVDISNVIERKIKALNAYAEEMRDYPHSRSIETVELLAKYRGSTMGMKAAESFKIERILVK
jgi:N-acetylglucosamine malate deacetylase 1